MGDFWKIIGSVMAVFCSNLLKKATLLIRSHTLAGELSISLADDKLRTNRAEHLQHGGTLSTSERSTVSICGQQGKPRSAITSVLVWRARASNESRWGFRIPVLSIDSCRIESTQHRIARRLKAK